MKKSLFALAALGAVSGVAHADVNLYGVLDVGVATLTNAYSFSPNFVTGAVPTGLKGATQTVTGMMNGGESPTRWGIKGSEDLGNGNSAFFKLESGFNLASGTLATSGLAGGANNGQMVADTSLNGQLFGRAAQVGLANKELGSLTFGRMNNLMLDMIGGYDPVNAQMFSPINFSGFYGGGGETDNARVDNAVKYANKFGNVNLNLLYSFGGIAGNSNARSNIQANLGYEAGPLGIQLAGISAKDTTSISANAAANTVNVLYVDLQSYMLTAKYDVTSAFSLKAGYERDAIKAPSNPVSDATMTQIYSYNIGTKSYQAAEQDYNVYWVGANYHFTPAVKGSIGYYDAELQSSVLAASGSDRYVSGMLEYAISKRTNLYAAAMFDNKGGSKVLSGVSNFNTYGIGMRHLF
ncbi:MAG: porin [Betaproteobacteria bacterium]|nr:porin [Betaproteobacteria bacterium]